jgi:outer membrane protein OmpA-like peptidoglycan-associated protein
MRNSVRVAIALAFGGLALPLHAEGPYAGFAGGGNYPRDQRLGNGQGTVQFEDGPLGVIGIGYGFASGLRPEVEFAVRDNDFDAPGDSSGEVESVMGNLWYDLPAPGFAPRLRPFIGAGAGTAEVDFNGVVDATGATHGGRESVTAYHGGAGLGFEVTPKLTVAAAYRYFETEPEHFTAGSESSRYRSDGVLLGARYTFGGGEKPMPRAAAEPPRVVEPQAEVAAFETVVLRRLNFQFDEADLTPPARESLAELASRLKQQQGVSVVIEGHTDAFGSDGYNLELGRKRAEAVKQYLVSRGVEDGSIEVASRGEDQPVASNDTEDGRAMNRRTELEPRDQPTGVKIVVQPPTEKSVEAAKQGDPGGQPKEE